MSPSGRASVAGRQRTRSRFGNALTVLPTAHKVQQMGRTSRARFVHKRKRIVCPLALLLCMSCAVLGTRDNISPWTELLVIGNKQLTLSVLIPADVHAPPLNLGSSEGRCACSANQALIAHIPAVERTREKTGARTVASSIPHDLVRRLVRRSAHTCS